MVSLTEKWGSKACWQRSLYSRSAIIWLFRDELMNLRQRNAHWLDSILKDAYLSADIQAKRFKNNQDTFAQSLELIKNNIDQRIAQAGDDGELQRLRKLADEARPGDSIRQIYRFLARKTSDVYQISPPRKTRLDIEWLNDHPLHSSRPGVFPDQYHLDACTRVQPDLSIIELHVFLDEFDVPSMLALPALLTHELVCHAYANEDRDDQWSSWAEGVMDWVAAFLFARWSPLLDLPYPLMKEYGEDLSLSRTRTPRYEGRAVADALVQWLVNEPSVSDLEVATQLVVRFALELNVADAPLLAKDELASRLAGIRKNGPLQQAFRSWTARDLPATAMLA